jgi:hypothetical protein
MEKRFQTFREFYPFYLGEHSLAANRLLHVIGMVLVWSWVIYCLAWGTAVWAWAAPAIGYGFAWVGHFFIEKNRPATFKYPFYSLMGDFRMTFDVFRHGRLLFEKRSAS